MHTDNDQISLPYFETPERSGCLRLVGELLRIGDEVPYLRGPGGAGKTRFAVQLLEKIEQPYVVVWLNARTMGDMVMALTAELGLEPDDLDWPNGPLRAVGEQGLLVVVDDADQLELAGVAQLFELHDAGARLLFLGNGGLSQVQGNWDLAFIDLPPFTPQQSLAFLKNAGELRGNILTDEVASGLHRAAEGLPGHLLDALIAMPVQQEQQATSGEAERQGGGSLPLLLMGGLIGLLVIVVVMFKDGVDGPAGTTPTVDALPVPQQGAGVQRIEREGAATAPAPQVQAMQPSSAATGLGMTSSAGKPAVSTDAEPSLSDDMGSSSRMPALELPVLQQPQPAVEAQPAAIAESQADDLAGSGNEPEAPVAQAGVAALQTEARHAKRLLPSQIPNDPPTAETAPAVEAAEADRLLPSQIPNTPADEEPAPVAEVPVAAAPAELADEAIDAAIAAVEQLPQAETLSAPVAPGDAGTAQAPPQAAVVAESQVADEPEPATAPSPEPAAPAAGAGNRGIAWVRAQSPDRYTLQLVAARDRNAIVKYLKRHGISEPYAIFARDLKGQPWYSLVTGSYADRATAVQARTQLPSSLDASGVWPRTFASIQEQLAE